MQAQVEATEKLLSTEQAANATLRTQTSSLSTELSSVKTELADTAQQLEVERSAGNELKAQLEAIKSEYITAGGAHDIQSILLMTRHIQTVQEFIHPACVCLSTW